MTMTREELNGKQTPGPVMFSTMEYPCVMCANHPQWNTADISEGLPNGHDETMANGTLYAEAHNVANRTGMWPEDLVAWLRKFEDLTPGGSEFANSPSEVYSYLRNRMDAVKEQHKRMKELEEGLRCCEFAMSNNRPQSKDGQEWEWGDVLTHARAILNKPTA